MRPCQASNRIYGRGLFGLVVLSLISGLFVQAASAQNSIEKPVDFVVFKNGDKLTGTLERAVGGSIIFKSDVVGEVTVPMDKVKELHSEGSFIVVKKDEKIGRTTKQPGNMTFNDD